MNRRTKNTFKIHKGGFSYEQDRFIVERCLPLSTALRDIFSADKACHSMPSAQKQVLEKRFEKIFKSVKPNQKSNPLYKQKGQKP